MTSSTRLRHHPKPRSRSRIPAAGRGVERAHALVADPALVERLSRTFRALGDPTRSRVVLALSLGELCVSDLASALGVSLSVVSHQLRVLRDLDIVRVRRAGRSQVYSLNEQAFGFCAPRVCQAWQRTLQRDALVEPGRSGPR